HQGTTPYQTLSKLMPRRRVFRSSGACQFRGCGFASKVPPQTRILEIGMRPMSEKLYGGA
ncbi:MAG: hypothetical protein AAFV98_24995, partial [Chloroflexota bacterium]